VTDIFTKRKIDDETLEEFEDLLLSADLGTDAADRVIARLRKERVGQDVSAAEIRGVLSSVIAETLVPLQKPLTVHPEHAPHVILVVGVNGAGKTTTIGKLASKFKADGHSVLLAAGDTFRAAAVEQLAIWGERAGVPVLTKPQGADAAGLAYEAIEKARTDGHDVVLIDTAGRLQNRRELMDELAKIVRVIRKLDPEAPHDTLLVLDATVGQNALSQAKTFTEIAGVTGLVMTKLDGTARGGILVALGDVHGLPIHYIGIGEGIDDLRVFDAEAFAEAMTADLGVGA
jgi:fused signal recognition particle receptor